MKQNRRGFLKAAIAAGAAPLVVPARVLGQGGEVAPSNRVTLGLIGCGGRMGGVWGAFAGVPGVQGVAVCDVWKPYREAYRENLKLPPEAACVDFRELLARKDVDAVAIATPDHWHVPQALAAVRAGKDVYCEKPLSNTIGEGRVLADEVKRAKAVFQHGTQLHSTSVCQLACEMAREGAIGKLQEIRIGSPAGHATGDHPEQPVPEGLEYDLWLGPAPVAPYTAARVFPHNGLPGWYFVSDYSKAGWIAGYAVHDLDLAHWGMGCPHGGPVSIEGQGVYPDKGLYDTVLTFEIRYEYANGVTLTLTNTDKNPHGVRFFGDKGSVYTRSDIQADPPTLIKEYTTKRDAEKGKPPRLLNHAEDFIACVKSRAEPVCGAEAAHRATTAALLGGIACRLKRKLNWDPAAERFINDDEANALLRCPQRDPWKV